MVYAPPQTTTATISRGTRGVLVVEVNQMVLGESPHLADAVHRLCEHAVTYGKTLVVTVSSGSGKQYMSINPDGHVSPAAAPAPGLAERRRTLGPLNLGSSEVDVISRNEWVEKHLLDPAMATPDPHRPGVDEASTKKRTGLFRRR